MVHQEGRGKGPPQERVLALDEPEGVAGWFEPPDAAWLAGGCQWWKYIEGEDWACSLCWCADAAPACGGCCAPPGPPPPPCGTLVFSAGRFEPPWGGARAPGML